jgi:hypothetical protein
VTSYLDLPRAKGSDVCLMLEKLCSVWGQGRTWKAHHENRNCFETSFFPINTLRFTGELHTETHEASVCCCSISAKVGKSSQILVKLNNTKFHENPLSRCPVVTCGQTDMMKPVS